LPLYALDDHPPYIGFTRKETAVTVTEDFPYSTKGLKTKKMKKVTKKKEKKEASVEEQSEEREEQKTKKVTKKNGQKEAGVEEQREEGEEQHLKEGKKETGDDYQYLIPHFEIIGNGLPSQDLGLPGDTYVDCANPSQLRLFGKGNEGWLLWPGFDTNEAPSHPFLSDYSLWVLGLSVGWFASNGIRANFSTRKKCGDFDISNIRHVAITKALRKPLLQHGVQLVPKLHPVAAVGSSGQHDGDMPRVEGGLVDENRSNTVADGAGWGQKRGRAASAVTDDQPPGKMSRVEERLSGERCATRVADDGQSPDPYGAMDCRDASDFYVPADVDSDRPQNSEDTAMQDSYSFQPGTYALAGRFMKSSLLYDFSKFLVDCCISKHFRGVQFPEHAGTLTWGFNGMKTVDTYVKIESEPAKEDDERFHLRYMAEKGLDASASSELPILHILPLPEEPLDSTSGMTGLSAFADSTIFTSRLSVMTEAVKYLSRGEAVAFTNYKSAPVCHFSVEGMRLMFGNVDTPVVCQGMHLFVEPA
jgi:hypothetical protein